MLGFLVSAISGLFLPALLGRAAPPGRSQALAGTGICLAWGALVFTVGHGVLRLPVIDLLLVLPVPLLFGGLILVGLAGLGPPGPGRAPGLLRVLGTIAFGGLLVALYAAVAALAHPGLAWGPPQHARELWIADASLGVTFGLLSVAADFYHRWPFVVAESSLREGEPTCP